MSLKLSDFCHKLGIEEREIELNKIKEKTKKVSLSELTAIISDFYKSTKRDFILYGQQITFPELLGFKEHLQEPEKEVKLVTNTFGILEIGYLFGDNEMYYVRENDSVFLNYHGIPFSFVTTKINGWKIPNDFKEKSLEKELVGIPIQIASPEHIIMLNLRNAYLRGQYTEEERNTIVSLLLAPIFEEEKSEINISELSSLFQQNISTSFNEILPYLKNLEEVKTKLRRNEQMNFDEIRQNLITQIKAKYFH